MAISDYFFKEVRTCKEAEANRLLKSGWLLLDASFRICSSKYFILGLPYLWDELYGKFKSRRPEQQTQHAAPSSEAQVSEVKSGENSTESGAVSV